MTMRRSSLFLFQKIHIRDQVVEGVVKVDDDCQILNDRCEMDLQREARTHCNQVDLEYLESLMVILSFSVLEASNS